MSSSFDIITDSTTDLTPALIAEANLHIVPLHFTLDGAEYVNYPDERELSAAEFYAKLRAGGMSVTTQLTPQTFVEYFTPFLQSGKDVLYLAFSSSLSGTCDSGRAAADELAKTFPDRRVVVVDTLAASMGEGLLAFEAAQLRNGGASLDETAAFCVSRVPNLCHWFTVDDLKHIKRGGRISAAAALLGGILYIKPVMHLDSDGKLVPVAKVRGRHKALEGLCERMRNSYLPELGGTVFVSHSDCLGDAEFVAEYVRRNFPVRRVEIGGIGPVIGSHSGPGTVALFFWGKER
ncbi:MAG: DegV family protein [Oscillospiraceae bacterium]|jgi:DegV family protein with EDD domain|nr:DegV family protein [Oscillospiraceae bacterium]